MRQLDGITDSGHEIEQTQGDRTGRIGSLTCCNSWGCKESDMTEQKQMRMLKQIMVCQKDKVQGSILLNLSRLTSGESNGTPLLVCCFLKSQYDRAYFFLLPDFYIQYFKCCIIMHVISFLCLEIQVGFYCSGSFFLFIYLFQPLNVILKLMYWFHMPFFRRRQWQTTPVLLPGKSHGRRSLVGCSPWGREESDTTEQLHFHFSLSCIGEGNGNPLQCSCLENPREGEPGGLPSVGSHRVRHD